MTDLELRPGLIIDNCEWRIATFVAHDAYVGYDWAGAPEDPATTMITERQIGAVNASMRARMPRAPWANRLNTPLPELRLISPDLDLVDSPEDDVQNGIDVLALFTMKLAEAKGLRDMGVSKVLHLVRPRFVAISDEWVRALLGVNEAFPHWSMRAVQEGIRELYVRNRKDLDALHAAANSLPPLTGTGRFAGQVIPVSLTKIRVLDILLWSSMATRQTREGSFMNQGWGDLYLSEIQAVGPIER